MATDLTRTNSSAYYRETERLSVEPASLPCLFACAPMLFRSTDISLGQRYLSVFQQSKSVALAKMSFEAHWRVWRRTTEAMPLQPLQRYGCLPRWRENGVLDVGGRCSCRPWVSRVATGRQSYHRYSSHQLSRSTRLHACRFAD